MARTNYDPLDRDPLFGCDVAVLVTEPRKPVRELAGNYR